MMLPKLTGIYAIENMTNGKQYIGSSINMAQRRRGHLGALCRKDHKNPMLQAAFNKYGRDGFRFRAIVVCERDELLYYEKSLIAILGPFYNWIGVDKSRNWQFPDELKAKVSAAKKGMKFSEDHKRKLSDAAKRRCAARPPVPKKRRKYNPIKRKSRRKKGPHKSSAPPWKGGHLSLEHRRRLSEARLGATWSDEMKKKFSRVHSKLSDDTIRDIRRRIDSGESQASVARTYNLSDATISRIKVGRVYGWVE